MKKAFFLLLLLLPFLVIAAEIGTEWSDYQKSGHRSEIWDEYVEAAFRAVDKGNLSTAGIFLEEAYKVGCRDPLVLTQLGLFAEIGRDLSGAKQYFLAAVARFPRHYPTHVASSEIDEHLGRVLFQLGEKQAALAALNRALEFKPHDLMLLVMSGQLLREEGNRKLAKVHLEKAFADETLKQQPEVRKIILKELMILSFDAGDDAACIAYAGELLTLSPQDQAAHTYRRRAQERQFRVQERESLKRLVK